MSQNTFVAIGASIPPGGVTGQVLTKKSNSDGDSDWEAASGGAGITQLTGDVTAGPGPGSVAATVAAVGGSTAANVHTGELSANAATSANTLSTIVKRDGSGNFAAGTITASLSGNATSATTATTATSFSGSLVGDVTGTQGATVVSLVGTSSAANVHSAELAANAATNLNTVSTIVKRDGSGNFSAGTITAALTGNATTATTAINFSGALVGDMTGTQGATTLNVYTVTGTRGAPVLITAVGGITSASTKLGETQFVQGNGGPIVISANPQINVGTIIGQQIRIIGTDNTNTVQLSDGTGLILNGNYIMANNSLVTLVWDGSNWIEVNRNDL